VWRRLSKQARRAPLCEICGTTDALTADHRRLYRANMAEEARRFTAALRSDAILPEGF